MDEITLDVRLDEESGWLTAVWDDPTEGGITTQGQDLKDLHTQVMEAEAVHFEGNNGPSRIRLHVR